MNSMVIEFDSLVPDQPTSSGRVYSREVCEQIASAISEKKNEYGMFFSSNQELDEQASKGSTIDLTQVTHLVVNFQYNADKEKYIATVKILKTPAGENLLKVIDNMDEFCAMPRGTGVLDENNKVTNYKLISIDILPKELSSVYSI